MISLSVILDGVGLVGFAYFLNPLICPPVFRYCLALTLSLALSSAAVMSSLIITGSAAWTIGFWLTAAVPLLVALARWRCAEPLPSSMNFDGHSSKALLWAASFATFFALVAVVLRSLNRPYGGWDALAIWNLKARFLYFGMENGNWNILLSPELLTTHPDYPLLLPTLIARYWSLVGAPTQAIPALWCIIVLLLTVFSLHSAVSYRVGRDVAHASVLILLSATYFVQHAASQFADNTLALLVLQSGIIFRSLLDTTPRRPELALLFGLLLGFTTSIKNEGLLISAVFLTLFAITAVTASPTRKPTPILYVLTASGGWLLIALPTLLMKKSLELSNDLVGAWSKDAPWPLLSADRLLQVIENCAPLVADFLALPVIIALAAGLAFYGRWRPRWHVNSVLLLAAPLLIMSGYLTVLWITPHDISWHVATTIQRLLTQIWPLLIFAACSLLRAETKRSPSRPV